MNKTVIVMKVGPHSGMSLNDIIESKKVEEKVHGVHYWGYSGSFCRPKITQEFCKWSLVKYNTLPTLVLLETKSAYESKDIGFIREYSEDNFVYKSFDKPVQLRGAQFSFVACNIRQDTDFILDNYLVFGGKNDGKPLIDHLRFRVNKAFAVQKEKITNQTGVNVLVADMVSPYAIWLRE